MPGTPNVIPLQSHPRARAHGESGAALDVVAQLFDQLARDASLPPVVRAELSRLRIPVLRATQVSQDFLVNRAHPARRLADAIGMAALGLDDAVGEADATVTAITTAVHTVLNEFDADVAPFEAAATCLEDFIANRTRAEEGAVRPMIQALVQRETEDLPRRAAQEEVARRLRARLWIPPQVRAMLSGPWAAALALTYRDDGEGSASWNALVRTMDELLWSVEPKSSAEGRRRLAAVLPDLVEALGRGLDRAQVAQADRDAFLSALVDCHAQAMKAGLRGLMLVADSEASTPEAVATFASASFDAGARRVESIRLAAARSDALDRADEAVLRMQSGAWIELERGGRVAARKRLAWVSPLTGTLLFVGHTAEAIGVAITPDALAEKVRRGEARVLDGSSLVERTLAALVTRLAPQG
jgi:hypothetical protein